MASKGKKRRDTRRLRKRREEESATVGERVAEDVAEEDDSPPEPVQEVLRRRVPKKRQKRAGPRFRINAWFLAAPVAIGGVIAIVVLVLTSGSSGVTAPKVEMTPDPRVEGLSIAQTIEVEAGGREVNAFFFPNNITGPVGEAFEIVVTNTGSLSHNLAIAGLDGEYGTSDDWSTDPELISVGERGSVVLMIEEPGTYFFRCIIHPVVQTGELTIQ